MLQGWPCFTFNIKVSHHPDSLLHLLAHCPASVNTKFICIPVFILPASLGTHSSASMGTYTHLYAWTNSPAFLGTYSLTCLGTHSLASLGTDFPASLGTHSAATMEIHSSESFDTPGHTFSRILGSYSPEFQAHTPCILGHTLSAQLFYCSENLADYLLTSQLDCQVLKKPS